MVRRATMSEAEAICGLINYYAERGRMLHRSLENVYESIRDFLVCQEDGQAADAVTRQPGGGILGCVAVSVSWKDLGEIRSLAVAPEARGKGIGGKLVAAAAGEARGLGLTKIFALTYEPKFFQRCGFRIVDRETLPTKVWRDCIHCTKADACDEIAMVLDL